MKPSITDKDGLLRLEDQLCFALYSTSRAITKQYALLLSEMGITYPQYLVLMVLWSRDGLLVSEVAKALELEPATTTPLIQRLEKQGLVDRKRSSEDERRVHVFLTGKGRSFYQEALKIPHALGCATGVTPETAAKLIAETQAIKDYIEANSD